jgi:hypothetical protein
VGTYKRIMSAEERIEIRLPSSLAIVSGVNRDGDWICNVEAVAADVETGEREKFGSTVRGGHERATREEMAKQLADWFLHEVLEQLGCKPEHHDGPEED